MAETHVVMGRIGASWGVKGWVKLFSFTDPVENLLDYRFFYIEGAGGLQKINVDESKRHGKGFVAHIKGCDAIEATGAYTGCELLIPKSQLPSLDEGYYWHQLEGLQVVTKEGEVLGRVDHLIETGSNDVFVIKSENAVVEGEKQEDILVPYIPGQVVKDIDLEQGLITVDWDKNF